MNVIYVDDDADRIAAFEQAIDDVDQIAATISMTTARTRAECEKKLFDGFVVCSRGLTKNGRQENCIERLLELLEVVQQSAPSTPVYLLTDGDLGIDAANILLKASHNADVWGNGTVGPTVSVVDDLTVLRDELVQLANAVLDVDRVAINSRGKSLLLKAEQKRLLRVFVRRFRGDSVYVEQLDGGLSGSRVLRLDVKDKQGVSRIAAVGKLDRVEKVDAEVINYSRQVARLPGRAYAPQVGVIKGAAAGAAGVFYRLLNPTDIPLFQVLSGDSTRAAEIVISLMELMSAWHADVPATEVEIASIRRAAVSDDEVSAIAEKFKLDWIQELERIVVHSRTCCIHGDLHAGNVFVGDDNSPVMLDFADVREGPSVLDPVTLELSLFCHPSTKELISWLPDLQNPQWSNLDAYLVDCPYADYIMACRQWSHEVGGGDQAVNAGAYAYLMRQLKYSDVDPDLVLALLTSVKESILTPE